VSSNVQTQLDAKLSSATASSTYAPLLQTTTTPTFSTNNYTLIAGDAAKIVLASNSTTAGTVTIPSGVFTVGQVITIVQTGSGQLTLTASGTTLNSQGSKLKLSGQYASCQLVCTASNTFIVFGNLAA
jgi:predicted ATP-dependent Lon-type protease